MPNSLLVFSTASPLLALFLPGRFPVRGGVTVTVDCPPRGSCRLRFLGGAGLDCASPPACARAASPRQLALLAILVTRPGGVCRDRLLALLWPDTGDKRARHQLSDAMYFVRGAFGREALVVSGPSLRIDPALVPNDVAMFEAAAREGRHLDAAAVWAGPFLDGFHAGCGSPFEEWLTGERNRYSGLMTEVLERLAGTAEESGDLVGARRWWDRLAQHDPLSSRALEGVMRVLSGTGDAALALRRYRMHQDRLRAQFDLAPPRPLRDLADRIRRGPRHEGTLDTSP